MILYATTYRKTIRTVNGEWPMLWTRREDAEREAAWWKPCIVGVLEVDVSPAQLELAAIDGCLAAREQEDVA